jgi:hypothetical protein
MRSLILVALFAGASAACGRTGEPIEPADTHQVQAGDTVELRFGESAQLGDAGVRITFTRVAGDSRCPVDVTCVWAGDAHVQLEATAPSADGATLDLHTGVAPVEVEFAGYRIRLTDVSPQRREADGVKPRDYSVRLAISRG